MLSSPNPTRENLYESDYYLWLQTIVESMKAGDLTAIDWENLIEEIEEMGRREKRAVFSNLKILLMHLLKYKYQPQKRSNSWLFTILEHRQRLQEDFEASPSLKNYFRQCFEKCYLSARQLAATETGLPLVSFPEKSPFTPEETLNTDFLPKKEK